MIQVEVFTDTIRGTVTFSALGHLNKWLKEHQDLEVVDIRPDGGRMVLVYKTEGVGSMYSVETSALQTEAHALRKELWKQWDMLHTDRCKTPNSSHVWGRCSHPLPAILHGKPI